VLAYSLISARCAAILLLACIEERGPLATLLRSRALQRCGILAYGLYLFHQPVNGLAHALVLRSVPALATVPAAALTAAALVVTFVLAELSWRLLEHPLVALGHRMRYTNRHRAAA
jgi:peptidoglycan/LPS O-acetylase OafA/YrhL